MHPSQTQSLAHAAYGAALDREHAAAGAYARLARSASGPMAGLADSRCSVDEPEVAHPLAVRPARGRRGGSVLRRCAGISIDRFALLQADGPARSSQAGTDLLIFA